MIVCAITSNLDRAAAPGNVLLRKRRSEPPKPSVVNVSQTVTVDKKALADRIGVVSAERVRQILDGVRLLTEPRQVP